MEAAEAHVSAACHNCIRHSRASPYATTFSERDAETLETRSKQGYMKQLTTSRGTRIRVCLEKNRLNSESRHSRHVNERLTD